MDTKDWAGMREVFVDDVVIDTRESGGDRIEGADTFMAFLQDALGEATTVHQGHMPEIDVTSDATASGIWSLNDIIIRSEENTSELQSLMRISYAVFCLNKKKTKQHNRRTT